VHFEFECKNLIVLENVMNFKYLIIILRMRVEEHFITQNASALIGLKFSKFLFPSFQFKFQLWDVANSNS